MKDISRYVPTRRPGRNGTQYIKNLTLQTLLFDV
ncbi:predicted protein [Botrytis cinerea T4]|uniref:Uncharacterized protein n=1 Tax=Botryotinia fuckeliana (strain T4) TaxID=999810 RepID=G2YCW8_BOTF4|nr:predicted protein [Botrytis cinerea T4]